MAVWNRRQYLDLLLHRPVPRPMFVELFGPLIGLEAEWREQGASDEEIALTAFGFDRVWRTDRGVDCHLSGRNQRQLIEETPTHRIERDGYGRLVRCCTTVATIPLPLTYPVAARDDWEAIKDRYRFSPVRLQAGWDRPVDPDCLVVQSIPGGFDELRQLMGEEELCCAVYDDPELIHDMLTTIGDCVVSALEHCAAAGARIDQLSIHEDMAGKSGPLFGPTQIETFLTPYYRRCWAAAQACGAQLFDQDSDGDMRPVIDVFLDAGINVMHPFEPAAGMDMVAARHRYGERLAIKGGIDKHALRAGIAAIDRELDRKLQDCMRRGTVFGLDHRIPNGTPLAAYRHYVARSRELLGLDPRPEPGWERMAF